MPSKPKGWGLAQLIKVHTTFPQAAVKVKYNVVWRFPWHPPNRVETHWFKTLQILETELLERSGARIWEALICLWKPELGWSFKTHTKIPLCLPFPLGFSRRSLRTACSEGRLRGEVGHPGWLKFLHRMWNPVSLSEQVLGLPCPGISWAVEIPRFLRQGYA